MTILEFTETATFLDLKTMLLLIEPKMVMGQFCDQMTSYSSMGPVVISSPHSWLEATIQSPKNIPERAGMLEL